MSLLVSTHRPSSRAMSGMARCGGADSRRRRNSICGIRGGRSAVRFGAAMRDALLTPTRVFRRRTASRIEQLNGLGHRSVGNRINKIGNPFRRSGSPANAGRRAHGVGRSTA